MAKLHHCFGKYTPFLLKLQFNDIDYINQRDILTQTRKLSKFHNLFKPMLLLMDKCAYL